MSSLEMSVIRLHGRITDKTKCYIREHYVSLLKFAFVGVTLTLAQMRLQTLEVDNGLRGQLVWLSFIQGSMLAQIGLVANWWMILRPRRIPLGASLIAGNLQKIPHSLGETSMYALLLQLVDYRLATLATAGIVGMGSFLLLTWWSTRFPRLVQLTASLAASLILAVNLPERRSDNCVRPGFYF